MPLVMLLLTFVLCVILSYAQQRRSAEAAQMPATDPVVAAAGDIACDQTPNAPPPDADEGSGGCKQTSTGQLLSSRKFDAILTLGDEQYDSGTLPQFMSSYDKTWGRYKDITYPIPGNHEYETPGASGYYSYYGARAGDPKKGYYSFGLGAWHVIAINANCADIGGCNKGSAEERWLRADLSAHPASCTLAYWHQPRFSSGHHHSDPTYDAFWQDLYAVHADLVLNGHDHLYERFAPQTPSGSPASNGIREIIAGTGGRSHYQFTKIEPNSEVRNNTTFGILELTLHPHSYDWRFVPVGAGSFSDTGSQRCHGRA
ncbi:MAG: metallophosphoesterase [Candidatus Eremiobacteraeota bacterium]|nr:metallophosphoesterase [Candidatus Eremiobacteraeota bacterium]